MLFNKFWLIGKRIQIDNYLSNCYRRLIRSRIFHFLFLLIELFLMASQAIDIFNRGFRPRHNKQENEVIISPIIILMIKLDNVPEYINYLIIVLSMIIFDSLYIYLCNVDIKGNYKILYVIINFLEIFYFRLYILFFYTLLFTLTNLYFVTFFVLSLFHAYLIINNFRFNHLYYYVPEFVDYPYDEFSSIFDLYLFIIKIIISIASVANNVDLAKFFYIIAVILQIFFCLHFIDKLFHHSYLFMKNTFLNKLKLSFLFAHLFVVFISILIFKSNYLYFLFVFLNLGIIIIFMGYFFLIYNPFSFIKIKNKSSIENILYYLNIINERKDIIFIIENKLLNHYRDCGLCPLCKKYICYRTEQKNDHNNNDAKDNMNENQLLIKGKNNIDAKDLFSLLYDGKKKYFKLIEEIEMNYKKYGKMIFNNNAYYYTNLLNLIYCDYLNKDITLSLNEKIILEIINKENISFLEKHQIQINQLLLCKEFISLGKKALNSIKDILNNEQNFSKARKLILLSDILLKMKNKKYKNLLNNKTETSNASKYLLLSCSIIYEEIFNTTLGNSQIPIRDNIQPLEDIFRVTNKNNNIITLDIDLLDYNCVIIRAGKGLSSHLNKNFYDLFPSILRQYQINLFIKTVFNGFKYEKEKNLEKENNKTDNKKGKNDRNIVEIKLVINEFIDNKIYYKLLTIKLIPIFNNDNSHYIYV